MSRRTLLALGVLAASTAACGPSSRHFFVNTEGQVQLKVALEGQLDSGVILLMLHGGPVGSSHVYNSGQAMVDIESRYAVAYLDQRGQGGSQGRMDTDTYDLDAAARDVDTVIDVLRARYGEQTDLYLLGHSWGGMLGTLALTRTDVQDELSGWIETAGCHDSAREPRYVADRLNLIGEEELEEERNVADWEEILEFVNEGFDPDAGSWSNGELVRLNRYGYRAESLIDEVEFEDPPPEDRWVFLRNPSRTWIGGGSASRSLDVVYTEAQTTSLSDDLDEIAIPGQYLYARYDFVCPPQLGEDAAAANTSGTTEYVLFESSGHSLMSNEPALFSGEILDFVEDTR